MYKKEDTLLTIGQFAALHEINKKTLMWYDETGLLKPACIKENGYRYYTYRQSHMLETILMLRELNVSIREIQNFMKDRSAANLQILLTEKIGELDHTISHLKAVRKTLSRQQQNMADLVNMDLSEISVVEKEKQYLAVVRTTADLLFEKEVEMVMEEARKHRLRRLHDAAYGSMISAESLYCGSFDDYTALFIEMPNPIQKKGLHVRPAGKYLRAFCKGSWEKLPGRYRELLDYAKSHGLVLSGFAYETGINEIVIDEIDDYITQIEIPIKTRQQSL